MCMWTPTLTFKDLFSSFTWTKMELTNSRFYKAGFRLAGISAIASSVHGLHSEHTGVSRFQPVTNEPTSQSSNSNIHPKLMEKLVINMQEDI